jgi:hypothetical protein
VVAVGPGDVLVPVHAQRADGQASEGRHDAGCVPGPDQGLIFLVSHVADPVELVLDLPVPFHPGCERGRVGRRGCW